MIGITIVPCDDPLPPRRRAVLQEQVFGVLGSLKVGGGCVEMNRSLKAAANYVYRYRRLCDARGQRFAVRPSKPNWVKIWRVA
jgi:hypothetical protein